MPTQNSVTSHDWVEPFLAALEAGRGVRAAIAAAKISVSTAYKLRERDAGFARAWTAAVAPHALPGDRRREARPRQSTKLDRFFAALAETSDVAAAAQQAGLTPASIYKRRREDREFARRWYAALAEGYDNLEMELLARLRGGQGAETPEPNRKIDTAAALRSLAAHRESVARDKGRRRLEDECITIASINARIDKMRLNREASDAAIAAARAENAARRAAREPGASDP